MRSDNSLGDAAILLFDYLQRSRSAEEERLLYLAYNAVSFLSRTGQLHPFEEFHKSTRFGQIRPVSFVHEVRLLERLWAQATDDDKDALHVATSALAFIESSKQREALAEYLSYKRSGTLPPVVAAFKSHEEAEAWLNEQSAPPTMARVLIGDMYHTVVADREQSVLPFTRSPVEAELIERTLRNGLPPAAASFATRQEAESWFANTPEPPRHAFITIQGEYHLAAFWKNINHRAIYPFTLVDDLRKERQERDAELATHLEAAQENPGEWDEPSLE